MSSSIFWEKEENALGPVAAISQSLKTRGRPASLRAAGSIAARRERASELRWVVDWTALPASFSFPPSTLTIYVDRSDRC